MYVLLWQANENRLPGDDVTLLDLSDYKKKVNFSIGKTYQFLFYSKSGQLIKRLFIEVFELTINVFDVSVFSYDISYNDGHTGISVKFGTKKSQINLVGEFIGDQYKLELTRSILDLEGLNRLYWNNTHGFSGIEISTDNVYKIGRSITDKLFDKGRL